MYQWSRRAGPAEPWLDLPLGEQGARTARSPQHLSEAARLKSQPSRAEPSPLAPGDLPRGPSAMGLLQFTPRGPSSQSDQV